MNKVFEISTYEPKPQQKEGFAIFAKVLEVIESFKSVDDVVSAMTSVEGVAPIVQLAIDNCVDIAVQSAFTAYRSHNHFKFTVVVRDAISDEGTADFINVVRKPKVDEDKVDCSLPIKLSAKLRHHYFHKAIEIDRGDYLWDLIREVGRGDIDYDTPITEALDKYSGSKGSFSINALNGSIVVHQNILYMSDFVKSIFTTMVEHGGCTLDPTSDVATFMCMYASDGKNIEVAPNTFTVGNEVFFAGMDTTMYCYHNRGVKLFPRTPSIIVS